MWKVRRGQRMIRRAYRSSTVTDPGVSEPGAVRRPGDCFDAPLHAPYVFVVGVEKKIYCKYYKLTTVSFTVEEQGSPP